jgi:hypothetical protein
VVQSGCSQFFIGGVMNAQEAQRLFYEIYDQLKNRKAITSKNV